MRNCALVALILVFACGRESNVDVLERTDAGFKVIDDNCNSCHDFTPTAIPSSAAKRVEKGSMPPPPRQLSADTKAAVLAFLK